MNGAIFSVKMMTIGALSRQTGVAIETIRYYERAGLLPRPARSAGGRRLYVAADGRRLTFIRRARELGFSLDEVRELLDLARGRHASCRDVKALAERRTADIRRKIADLRKLDRALSALAAQCGGEGASACPLIEALDVEALRVGAPGAATASAADPD